MQKTISKLGLMLIAAAFTNGAYAIADGAYLGVQFGATKTYYSPQTAEFEDPLTITTVTPKNNGFAGRVFFGYQFNPYVGIEGAYMRFSEVSFDVPEEVATCSDPTITIQGLDFAAKGIWPVFAGIILYGKGGVALDFVNKDSSLISGETAGCGSSEKKTAISPLLGIGIGYALTQSLEADLSWTRILGKGVLSKIDFVALEVSYHFVDKYCGQFLC